MAKGKAGGSKASSKKADVINPVTVADKDSVLNKLAITPSENGAIRCRICGKDIEFNPSFHTLYEEECIARTHKMCWVREQA